MFSGKIALPLVGEAMVSFIQMIIGDSIVKALGFGMAILCVFAYLIAMLCAIIGHELSHGYVALWNGDKTAKFLGRLSLNPVKHFDPIGLGMMLLVGFGWAKPVPIDPRNFKKYKKGMVLTALAGVTYNFIMAIISSLCLAILMKITGGVVNTESGWSYVIMFLYYLFQLSIAFNVALMVFNLLPIYPLDGFRVVETLSKPNNKYVDFMYKHGAQVMIAFLLICFVLGRFIPQVDILSNIIRLVRKCLDWVFTAIFGLPQGTLLG
ncbi:MAG: site-2 protease family protein [Clostridia bacterium]|nr:site-2 protease family protein [Clostridia bacterium]